ncbi:competence type IV pilus minor pilin ComGG [Heyndrickxia oleronia]|uniref:Competence type IV pilus minor pilin ComGG n=1 Tax=Heyndrickxia oleronia TaxID=38875 RepID=A0AAW6SPF8_9BACI|nr:competence type IV pilus minor pilin ComGG [Heyndrickxia oleronia]MDH5160115.1 competence type IV pilus minor pilin ComGG [Heyndrickxia oleronia]
MRNQKGFVFPLVLGVIFITFLFLTSSTHIYLSEKRYLHETKGYYISNSLNVMAIKSLIRQIENQNNMDSGTIAFNQGKINYHVYPQDEENYLINITTSIEHGRGIKYQVLYSIKDHRLLKWNEN